MKISPLSNVGAHSMHGVTRVQIWLTIFCPHPSWPLVSHWTSTKKNKKIKKENRHNFTSKKLPRGNQAMAHSIPLVVGPTGKTYSLQLRKKLFHLFVCWQWTAWLFLYLFYSNISVGGKKEKKGIFHVFFVIKKVKNKRIGCLVNELSWNF